MKKYKNEPSRIIGIQFSILSPHEIEKASTAEITNRDTFINNKPVLGGLFGNKSAKRQAQSQERMAAQQMKLQKEMHDDNIKRADGFVREGKSD